MTFSPALNELLAASPAPTDVIAQVEVALRSGNATTLNFLRLGAELHRAALRERQAQGIHKAKKVVSKYKGRKPSAMVLSKAKRDKLSAYLQNHGSGGNKAELARLLKISRTTLYRYLAMETKVVEVLRQSNKATGQLQRGNDKGHAQSVRKAEKTFSEGRQAIGLKVSHRPVLEEARAVRKERRRIDLSRKGIP